ncbi:MAG: FHA domain-containing protein, partial [Planctomycetota bacterium]
MAQLVIIDGFNVGETYTLSGEALIGRSLDNSICLPDGRASRKHARLYEEGGHFYIEDLGSANGTMVHARTIPTRTPTELHNGDEMTICSTTMRFINDAEETKLPSSDFGNLTVSLSGSDLEEDSGPEVNMTIDAQQSMMEIHASESGSDQGLQAALKRMQAICKVSAALGTVMDQKDLMQKIMDCIFDIFPTAERAFIMLNAGEDGELVPVAARRRVEVPGVQEEVAISRTI